MARLIDADEFAIEEPKLWDWSSVDGISSTAVLKQCIWDVQCAPKVDAIPIEQLLSILPKYDDYIHTKTYPYEFLENIYSQGYEDGWNACVKAIKEELDYWRKENEQALLDTKEN